MSTHHIPSFQKPLIGKATCGMCGRDFEITLHSEEELTAWIANPYVCEECRQPILLSQIADPMFLANWLSLDPDDLPDLDNDEDFDDLLDDLEPYAIYDGNADAAWHPEIALTPDPRRDAWRNAFDALPPEQRRYCYIDCPLS